MSLITKQNSNPQSQYPDNVQILTQPRRIIVKHTFHFLHFDLNRVQNLHNDKIIIEIALWGYCILDQLVNIK